MKRTHVVVLDDPIILPVAFRDEPVHILGASVNWRHGWANDPDLEVQIDGAAPIDSQLAWEVYADEKANNAETLWYGATDLAAELHLARFFAWRGPGNAGGLGGSKVAITLRDGTPHELLGPWVGCVRDWHEPGEPAKATEIALFDKRFSCAVSYAASLPLARLLCEKLGVHLVQTPYSFSPSLSLDSIVKPSHDAAAQPPTMKAAHLS